jgi:hypothetical protein
MAKGRMSEPSGMRTGGRAAADSVRNLRMSEPVSVRVRSDGRGVPLFIRGEQIELVRESWLVEDRWWTGRPLRRRYWELVSVRGRNTVVFHDLCSGEWFQQRG